MTVACVFCGARVLCKADCSIREADDDLAIVRIPGGGWWRYELGRERDDADAVTPCGDLPVCPAGRLVAV